MPWLPSSRPSQADLQLGIADPSLSSLAGPGEAVPKGFQHGRILWGWRGFLPVQRVRALPGGAATRAHPHRCPDKAGAPGLGPVSVPTRGPLTLGAAKGPGNSAGEFCLYLLSGRTEGGAGRAGAQGQSEQSRPREPPGPRSHGNRIWSAGGMPPEGLLM